MADGMIVTGGTAAYHENMVNDIATALVQKYFDFGEGGEDAEWTTADDLAEIIVDHLDQHWYYVPKDVIDYPEEGNE